MSKRLDAPLSMVYGGGFSVDLLKMPYISHREPYLQARKVREIAVGAQFAFQYILRDVGCFEEKMG